MLYAWTDFAAAGLGSPNGSQPAYSAPWPMFRGGFSRVGFPVPYLSASHSVLPFLQEVGSAGALQTTFRVINQGGGTLEWSSSAPGSLSLSPDSSTTASQTAVTVQVTVPAVGPGVYDLGTITLTSTNGLNTPFIVEVRRFVGRFVFLPALQR
jgi:hypothetical protein